MAEAMMTCGNCGCDKNPKGSPRCIQCGQALEQGPARIQRSQEEEIERRYQQEGLSLQWLGLALVVQAALTGIVIFGLPRAVSVLDFEGGNGMIMCIPIWFVGGILTGIVSPGRTFIEPTVAAFVVSVPTTFLLVESQTVRILPTFLYVILAAIGVLFTLIGAYVGERVQLGPPPKRVD